MIRIQLIKSDNHKMKKIISVDESISEIDLKKIASNKFGKKIVDIVDENNYAFEPNTIIEDQIFLCSTKNITKNIKSNEQIQQSIDKIKQIKSVIINVIADQSYIPDEAIAQFKRLSKLDDVTHIIGMPDLHKGHIPVGCVVITSNRVYPELIGTDIGCGMMLTKINMDMNNLTPRKLEKISQSLNLEYSLFDSIIDVEPLILSNLMNDSIDDLIKYGNFINSHNNSLGTIGGGNHFAELQKIHEIIDLELANKFYLDINSSYLTVHSGSRDFGTSIIDKLNTNQINISEYEILHNLALKWAKLNRQFIANKFIQQLNSNSSIQITSEQIIDLTHNYFERISSTTSTDTINSVQSNMIIHRKGAINSSVSTPLIIPGSRGSLTYVVIGTNSDITNGYSISHGAGRKLSRTDAYTKANTKTEFDRQFCFKSDHNISNIVICESKDLLYEEASFAYKDIDVVIADLVKFGLIKVICTLEPLITYKLKNKCC